MDGGARWGCMGTAAPWEARWPGARSSATKKKLRLYRKKKPRNDVKDERMSNR